ncbi:MAG: RNA methyltransferase [Rhodocyclaceae bacterium]|nr:RNA methyltransferase [Rhodocyclaceae bacterium]
MNTAVSHSSDGVSLAPTGESMGELRPLFTRIRIVLSHTSHPGNIGAAARAMKTMGLSRLVLVNPKTFPDVQADAMAAGADDVLANAQVVASLNEALVGTTLAIALTARRRELAAPPMWARDAAAGVVAHSGEIALVFGNETSGLSNAELAQCGAWAMIPVDAEFSSLNVAAAVQIMCYEVRQAAIAPGELPVISGAGMLATHDDVERLLAHFEQAALGSGFLDPASPKRLMLRLRRMFGRAQLEREEVAILRGLLASFEDQRR